MKACRNCRRVLPADAFARNSSRGHPDGREARCKECRRAAERARYWKDHAATRARNNAYWRSRPDLVRAKGRRAYRTPGGRARLIVLEALRSGRLVRPKICSRCHEAPKVGVVHGHHEDYARPIDVVWLCPDCHRLVHRLRAAGGAR